MNRALGAAMRWLMCGVLLCVACGDGNVNGVDASSPPDLQTAACVKNSDCPQGQLCMPPCNCSVGDGGARCDVFVASCVPTLQGFPCRVVGDHVECC
jgi:hypothetical protein